MVRHYPNVESKDFSQICKKREFKKYITKKTNDSTIEDSLLLPHQQFIANYIHPSTPYRGLLVYHETGTGKTCTAVSVAENFKDIVHLKNKKITILSSENIKQEFRKTIKSTDTVFKCTGNTYSKNINKLDLTTEQYNSKLNEQVDTFYNFMTYHSFGNELLKKFKGMKNVNYDKCVNYVKEKYSDTVLIVDEAHNLRSKTGFNSKKKNVLEIWFKLYLKNRYESTNDDKRYHSIEDIHEDDYIEQDDGDDDGDDDDDDDDDKLDRNKVSRDAIDIIVEHSSNLRLLFLTATPMFDNPIEIVWIINKLIKVNEENIEELVEGEIFDNDTFMFKNNESKIKFIETIKGKISYLRSGDPSQFPLRIESSDFLTMSYLSEKHKEIIKSRESNKDSIFSTILLHNVSWYSNLKKHKYSGLELHFDISLKKQPTIFEFKKKTRALDDIQLFAPKIKTITESIENMKDGIAFVFSKFIWSGIIPIALALENLGYSQYKENASSKKYLLKNRTITRTNNYYAIISSTPNISFEKQKNIIQAVRSEANKLGKIIRVILVSSSGGEGIDLKNIRQVHILEPHFNFSLLEQVIGRAIRTDSHKSLPDTHRNCTIFYHATKFIGLDDNFDGVEIDIYKRAIAKKKGIQVIRKLLQEYSVTCDFFKNTNEFELSKLKGKLITNSFGEKINYIPVENDEDYKTNCKLCATKDFDTMHDDLDTYHPLSHSKSQVFISIKWISNLFKSNEYYLLEDIVSIIQQKNSTFDRETIYQAMDLIENNYDYLFENMFGIRGLIYYDEPFYRFKPDYYDYTGVHNFISLTHSNINVPLKNIKFPDRPTINSLENISLVRSFDDVIKGANFSGDHFWDTDENLTLRNKLLAESLVDKISHDDRYILFRNSQSNPSYFNDALDRYKKNGGFLKVTSTSKQNKILFSDGVEIEEKLNERNFPNAKDLPLSSFIIEDNGHFIFKVLDRRTTKGVGANLGFAGDANKKKLIEIINFLFDLLCKHKNTPSFKRYSFETKDGPKSINLSDKKRKPNNKNIYLECEMLFRLLNMLKVQNKIWFVPPYEVLSYRLPNSAKV